MRDSVNWLVASMLCLGVGCAGEDHTTPAGRDALGSLEMPLVGVAPNGARYRLTEATFAIDGTESVTVSTDDVGDDADVYEVDLDEGRYDVRLEDGWVLKEVAPDGSLRAVPATLVDELLEDLEVEPNTRTAATFVFRVDGSQVSFGQGIGIQIEIEDETGDESPACARGEADDVIACAREQCEDAESPVNCVLSACGSELNQVSGDCQACVASHGPSNVDELFVAAEECEATLVTPPPPPPAAVCTVEEITPLFECVTSSCEGQDLATCAVNACSPSLSLLSSTCFDCVASRVPPTIDGVRESCVTTP